MGRGITTQIPDLAADQARAQKLVPVSRETLERLEIFVGLLLQRQQVMNLIAASTIPQVWTRHVADSLQLVALAPEAKIWVDLGSGGGFPGLVIACALAEKPGAKVHLVESTAKKCVFLKEIIDAIELPAAVHCQRIENFAASFSERPDIVAARALAPLEKLLSLAYPLLKKGAKGLFFKGQDVGAELTEATKSWKMQYTLIPSLTDQRGRIVVVESLESRMKGR